MAKTCMIEKEKHRKALNKQFKTRRANLKKSSWTRKRPWKTVSPL